MDDNVELFVATESEEALIEQTWTDGDPRPATLDVIITSEKGQGDFTMESDPLNGGVPIVQSYVVEFSNNQNGVYSNGFLVNICLPSGRGLNSNWTFDDDPIWAKLIDKHGVCPSNANQNDPSLFDPAPSLSADKRTLTFGNPNYLQQYFGFALRFANVNDKGKKLTYDPIGNNQNGSSFN